MESDSEYSFPENDNYKYKINHLRNHLTEEIINIRLISQSEIIFFQKKDIKIYAIDNKDKFHKKYTIQVNSFIKDILIKDNELIVSTFKGIIVFEKNKQNKYFEIKRIKPQNNETYYSLLDLKENNLICAFSVSFLNIIDLRTSNIISHFKFRTSDKGIKMEYNKEDIEEEDEEGDEDGNEDKNEKDKEDVEKIEMDEDKEEDNDDDMCKDRMISRKVKEILTLESFDPRARPFLIRQNNLKNYLICFKLLSYCVVLNYKTMKILKKFDFTDIFGFHLFKPDNEFNFFYILLIDSYKNPNFIIQKYNSDLKIIEQFKNKSFDFPNFNPFVEEGMQDDARTSTLICEDECIYKTIVKDVNNFSFLYHKYDGAPIFKEYYFLVHCVDGKFQKNIKLSICDDDENISFDMREIGENKYILVEAEKEKGIKEIKIERYRKKEGDKKEIKKSNKKKKITNKEISCKSESDSDSEEEQKDEKVKAKKKKGKKMEKDKKLLGKKKKIEKDDDESNKIQSTYNKKIKRKK